MGWTEVCLALISAFVAVSNAYFAYAKSRDDSRIKALEADAARIGKELADHKDLAAELEVQIGKLQAEAHELERQRDKLQYQIDVLKAERAECQARLATLESQDRERTTELTQLRQMLDQVTKP